MSTEFLSKQQKRSITNIWLILGPFMDHKDISDFEDYLSRFQNPASSIEAWARISVAFCEYFGELLEYENAVSSISARAAISDLVFLSRYGANSKLLSRIAVDERLRDCFQRSHT